MATYTASLSLGGMHPNDGGLKYSHGIHRLWVSENSRPALVLEATSSDITKYKTSQYVWIPERPETILADALLMITALGLLPDKLRFLLDDYTEMTGELNRTRKYRNLDLANTFSSNELAELRKLSAAESFGRMKKIICSVFMGSSIIDQTPVFDDYWYDYEILVPYRTRLFSRWTNQVTRKGEIPKSWDEILP